MSDFEEVPNEPDVPQLTGRARAGLALAELVLSSVGKPLYHRRMSGISGDVSMDIRVASNDGGRGAKLVGCIVGSGWLEPRVTFFSSGRVYRSEMTSPHDVSSAAAGRARDLPLVISDTVTTGPEWEQRVMQTLYPVGLSREIGDISGDKPFSPDAAKVVLRTLETAVDLRNLADSADEKVSLAQLANVIGIPVEGMQDQ